MDSDLKPQSGGAESLQKKPNKNSADKDKADFKTPEEIAAEQHLEPNKLVDEIPAEDQPNSKPSKLRLSWPPTKRQWIIVAVVVLLITCVGVFALTRHPKPVATKAPAKPKKVEQPKPTTVASMLTGLQVNPSVNQRPVTAIMVENSIPSRPQAGLSQAGVVFEAIAEGGITRFMALYQDNTPKNVGPIRSVRPYYEQWALGFDAAIAHVGGSPEALADLKIWNVKDLDQFHNGNYYHRISSRAAPHNVYTGVDILNKLEASKGYKASKYVGFARKAKEEPAKKPTAKFIDFSISGAYYRVHYDYDVTNNSYRRVLAGTPHTDANNNTQISPKVVIALVMPYSLAYDGYHSNYSTLGSGPVYIFQDGLVTTGRWSKPAATNNFTFTDANGKPILLNPGQSWLTAVAGTNKVSYAP